MGTRTLEILPSPVLLKSQLVSLLRRIKSAAVIEGQQAKSQSSRIALSSSRAFYSEDVEMNDAHEDDAVSISDAEDNSDVEAETPRNVKPRKSTVSTVLIRTRICKILLRNKTRMRKTKAENSTFRRTRPKKLSNRCRGRAGRQRWRWRVSTWPIQQHEPNRCTDPIGPLPVHRSSLLSHSKQTTPKC